MSGSADLVLQLQHQVRVSRRRTSRWIFGIFAVGLCVSLLGLVPAVASWSTENPESPLRVAVFAASTAFFGWVVLSWAAWPYLLRPRIVPYFASELGGYGGDTMQAFARGRALFREIAALDHLARSLGVEPLSTFGFAYDYYDQPVRWHAAAEGLRTVEALRRGIAENADRAGGTAGADVARDLASLAGVLRVAAARNVDFSLVLRLHAKEAMQGVCTREPRQGSFW